MSSHTTTKGVPLTQRILQLVSSIKQLEDKSKEVNSLQAEVQRLQRDIYNLQDAPLLRNQMAEADRQLQQVNRNHSFCGSCNLPRLKASSLPMVATRLQSDLGRVSDN